MKARTIILIAICGVVAIGAAVLVYERASPLSRNAATARFRETAITEVTRLSTDLQTVSNQLVAMARRSDQEDWWLSEHVVITKSGEWIVFVSKCSKEDPKIRDTFVCRASDGRWYESNFHFCIGAIVLRMEGQPEDLPSFIINHKMSELEGR